LFGGLGIVLGLAGGILGLGLLFARQVYHIGLRNSQLPLLAVLLVVIGVQFFISGLLADISIKNYYKENGKGLYNIEKVEER